MAFQSQFDRRQNRPNVPGQYQAPIGTPTEPGQQWDPIAGKWRFLDAPAGTVQTGQLLYDQAMAALRNAKGR
jgi:hypothetical protein